MAPKERKRNDETMGTTLFQNWYCTLFESGLFINFIEKDKLVYYEQENGKDSKGSINLTLADSVVVVSGDTGYFNKGYYFNIVTKGTGYPVLLKYN